MTVESNGSTPSSNDGTDRRPLREDFVRQLTWVLNSKNISHRELAEGVGWPNHTRIYRWLNLKSEPLPHEVFAIERWLKVPCGTLSLSLGYLPPEARSAAGPQVNLADALTADPYLPEVAKRIIRSVMAEYLSEAKSRR